MRKGHWLYSVFKNKCPKCQEGDFFPSKNPYNLKRLAETNENCSVCGLNLEVEPGFYFGAMYISYALSGGSGILLYWILDAFWELDIWTMLGIVLAYMLITMPPSYRLSRLAWINIFIHYKDRSEWEGQVKDKSFYHTREDEKNDTLKN